MFVVGFSGDYFFIIVFCKLFENGSFIVWYLEVKLMIFYLEFNLRKFLNWYNLFIKGKKRSVNMVKY